MQFHQCRPVGPDASGPLRPERAIPPRRTGCLRPRGHLPFFRRPGAGLRRRTGPKGLPRLGRRTDRPRPSRRRSAEAGRRHQDEPPRPGTPERGPTDRRRQDIQGRTESPTDHRRHGRLQLRPDRFPRRRLFLGPRTGHRRRPSPTGHRSHPHRRKRGPQTRRAGPPQRRTDPFRRREKDRQPLRRDAVHSLRHQRSHRHGPGP